MFALCPVNKLWIHDLFRELTINSLSLTRIHDGSITLSANSELIYYLFCILIYYVSHEFHNFFAKSILHSQFDSQINNEFAIFERNHCSNIFSVKNIWINYQFRKFTMVTLSLSPIDHVLTIFFVVSLWIDCFFSRKYYLSVIVVAYSLYATQIHNNSTTILWLFRELTMDSLFFPRIHYEFAIFSQIHYGSIILFADSLNIYYQSLWIGYFSCKNTMKSLSVSWSHYGFIIFFAKTLSIYYLCE